MREYIKMERWVKIKMGYTEITIEALLTVAAVLTANKQLLSKMGCSRVFTFDFVCLK